MPKVGRSAGTGRNIAGLLGLGISGTFVLTTIVALRHMLDTPQRLESSLPGESHFYKWKRGHVFYKVLGAADAPPLLLLHTPELAASAYEMRGIMEPLAQRYRVYAPDLLGFGLSDRPGIEYTAETYVALCRDFLKEVVTQPATIVASRLSCNYAVAVAATSPELCERLVLISPVALAGEPGTGQPLSGSSLPVRNAGFPIAKAWSELLQTMPVQWLLYPILSMRFVLRYMLARQHTRISDADLDYFYATTHQFGAQYASMALLAGKLARDVSQQIETLQQPALVIWGAEALNNARHIGNQQDVRPHTRLVLLPDAGLAVHEERPERVVTIIRQWIDEEKATDKVQTTNEVQVAAEEEVTATNEEEKKAVTAAPGLKITIEAYCVKCKQKRRVLNAQEVTMKNGRIAIRGTCEVCGSNLFRIGRLDKETTAEESL